MDVKLDFSPYGKKYKVQENLDILENEIQSDQNEDNMIRGTRMELSSGCIILVGNPEGQRKLGSHRHTWEDNIKMNKIIFCLVW
jgi:hypothetical protein